MPEAVSANITDLGLFKDKQLRNVTALAYSGVFQGDDQQTESRLGERINHALRRDFSGSGLSEGLSGQIAAMQEKYREKLAAKPYAELVQEGVINTLLDEYLGLLVKVSEEKLARLDHGKLGTGEEQNTTFFNELRKDTQETKEKYAGERKYYAENPQRVKDIAAKLEAVAKDPRFLPIDTVAVESGVVPGDKQSLRDLVDNVGAIQAWRSLKAASSQFNDDATLQEYAAKPEENKVRIAALAERLAHVTRGLNAHPIEERSPEVTAMTSLRDLVSAQLHVSMMQERPPEQLIAVEVAARNNLQETVQVLQVLARDFLDKGPSSKDPRTLKLKENFDKETGGQLPMSVEQAADKAAQLAKQAAEDLLQMQVIHGDAKLEAKINALAEAAGVDTIATPLKAAPHLIDESLLEIIRQKGGHVIVPPQAELDGYARKVRDGRAQESQTSIAI